MSLIEKAIERMQAQQRAGQTAGTEPPLAFGKVVTPLPRPGESGRTPAHPARIVEIAEGALRRAGLLPPEHQVRQIARQYRQIKRPLIAGAFGRGAARIPNGQLILLASAIPGEGKTFTSINLAFSLSHEKDLHVILVDADVAKPHISRLLGVDKEPGLLETLQDPAADLESVILPTSVAGLSVLPAGARSEHATELLASERMRDLVSGMLKRDPSRIVLFDSPPLLLTTESHALTQITGQIVLIVRAGMTPQRAVLDALGQVGEGKHVSLILNQSVA